MRIFGSDADDRTNPDSLRARSSFRFVASGIHLGLSTIIGALGAVLVFVVWYPDPYRSISGGLPLFGLLVGVDVALGPVLTMVAADPRKSRKELARDLTVIAVLQLTAFIYGMYSIAAARPVHLVFEVDRMRVVSAVDVDETSLGRAPQEFRDLPLFGPTLIAAVKPQDPGEELRSIQLGLGGIDLSMVPTNWRPYASQADNAWARSRPAAALIAKYPDAAPLVAAVAKTSGLSTEDLRFLPLQSRRAQWVTLLAQPGARVVGHLPFDGFF